MITLKQFFETVDYRITEGGDYQWKCFGDHAYYLSSWDGNPVDGCSANIVFDTKTQEVYSVEVCDYDLDRAYRLINPDYRFGYDDEASGNEYANQAWDDVEFTDLETDEDWLEKAHAILNGLKYDTRVQVPIDLDDGEVYTLMKIAHERDITLNSLVEEMLQQYIDQHRDRSPKKKKKRKD